MTTYKQQQQLDNNTVKQCCCQGLGVRGQGQGRGLQVRGHGQGLKQRKGHQCLERKFTSHKYVSFITISDLDLTLCTSRLHINL